MKIQHLPNVDVELRNREKCGRRIVESLKPVVGYALVAGAPRQLEVGNARV